MKHDITLLLDWDEVHYVSKRYEKALVAAIGEGAYQALKIPYPNITREEAVALTNDWYKRHPGTTLAKLLDLYPPTKNEQNQRIINTYLQIAHIDTHDIFTKEIPSNPEQGEKLVAAREYVNILILTNSPRIHWQMQAQHLYGEAFAEAFKGLTLCVDEMPRGVCKPQAQAYRYGLQKFGVNHPERVLFIDDSGRNLKSALEEVGINVIKIAKPGEDRTQIHAWDIFDNLQVFFERSHPFPEILSRLSHSRNE